MSVEIAEISSSTASFQSSIIEIVYVHAVATKVEVHIKNMNLPSFFRWVAFIGETNERIKGDRSWSCFDKSIKPQ